jgi:phage virion morphogenesis protein
MSVTIKVDDRAVQVETLGELRAKVTDYPALLKIAGNLMRASIARTFRDEGSPAGSWPRLALSTLKKKGYTAGHKLLIMSGRLFGSITYAIAGNVLTIGTNLVYAAVHQWGSKDRSGGSIGAQARIAGRSVSVSAHDALRVVPFKRYGIDQRKGHNVRVRAQGPSAATKYRIKAHKRFQNIPARPYLVFRPEDPSSIASGMQAYLVGARGIGATS